MAERVTDGESRDARASRRLRALVAVVGIAGSMVAGLVGGCSSSSTPPPMETMTIPTGTGDATVPEVTVITGGGGGASSSGSMVGNPFGNTSSGSSSGGTVDSGSGDDTDAGASDAMASVPDAMPNICPATYTAPLCGAMPCDLRSNTCCVDFSLNARCIAGANGRCNSNEATLHCTQACECSNGNVCCGVENTILGVVQTQCQSIADGGLCNPHPQTTTQASAQICATTDECKNGMSCLKQSCVYGAMLSVCGLQSQDPFDCVVAQ
jgi:hypothetical protein